MTLRDVYHCAIDKQLFVQKITQAQTYAADMGDDWITVPVSSVLDHPRERHESSSAMEIRLRVEAVNRWYVHDWNTLDNKIRSSIVEGVSVFLSMFAVPIERLWRSLKYEAVYLHEIADGFTARRVIGEWIGFYDTQRPHSALDGRPPAEGTGATPTKAAGVPREPGQLG